MVLWQNIEGKPVSAEAGIAEFSGSYDLIVLGMGVAGCMAVVMAARKGLKVLGIDAMNCMGGMGTAGAVYGYYYGSKGGLYEEIDKAVFEMERQGYTPATGINPEMKKVILEQQALSHGAVLCYESFLTGVFAEGNRIIGVRWFGPDGEKAAGGKIVLDCTGDAFACQMAGCALRKGRAVDAQSQPFSNVLVHLKDGKVQRHYTDCGYLDQNDQEEFSYSVIHSQTLQLHYRDSYENARFLYIAPLLGVREGNFIVGEESLTFGDYQQDKVTDKPLFYACSNVDNHSKDQALESEIQQDWVVAASLWGVNFSVPVSLGMLIPKGYEGLMAAGRCISIDHDMASCIRMNRDMQKCGEAAAIAAVVAVRDGVSLKDVDYQKMLPMLLENRCLDTANDIKLRNAMTFENEASSAFEWITDKEELKAALATEAPGIAIWSAKRLGDLIVSDLRNWVETGDITLKKHSAMALGLLGDPAGLPMLRQMAAERDGFVPKTSRKYNQARGFASIYLLGRMKDVESVPMLLELVRHGNPFPPGAYQPDEFISNIEEYFFQYFSHAVMALLKIGQTYKYTREKIAQALKKRVFNKDFSMIITYKAGDNLIYPMTGKIREVVAAKLEEWGLMETEGVQTDRPAVAAGRPLRL